MNQNLANYDPSIYPSVAVTVDLVVFAISQQTLKVALVERGQAPFKGEWALPGGFVGPDEDALSAAFRELEEETALDLASQRVHVEQLATYTAPDRDPRMRVVSVAHLVLLGANPESGANHENSANQESLLPALKGGTDASAAKWVTVSEVGGLAFDHQQILSDALERLAGKMEYSTIAAKLTREKFTMSELRDVYTAVWGSDLPAGNFTRKMRPSLSPTGVKEKGAGAPASLFTLGSEWISPPISKP